MWAWWGEHAPVRATLCLRMVPWPGALWWLLGSLELTIPSLLCCAPCVVHSPWGRVGYFVGLVWWVQGIDVANGPLLPVECAALVSVAWLCVGLWLWL